MYIECIWNVYRVYIECILYTYYIHTVYVLHTFYIVFVYILHTSYTCFTHFPGSSRKVSGVENHVFPKSFGDVWGMFWHHRWCLKEGSKKWKTIFWSRKTIEPKWCRITSWSFSTSQIIHISHLEPIYELSDFSYFSYFALFWILYRAFLLLFSSFGGSRTDAI